jgi:hypothetical protein
MVFNVIISLRIPWKPLLFSEGLLNDRGQAIISYKVEDILRTFCIDKWQSEPHQHHQNPAERRYQTVKNANNRILDRTGAPAHLYGYCAYNMFATYLIIRVTLP